MITDPLIEANSLPELQSALADISSQHWNARASHFLAYDNEKQLLSYRDTRLELTDGSQPVASALSLRTNADQDLSWPKAFESVARFRMSVPIFHYGSLSGVWCLGFDSEPTELEQAALVERALGILAHKVIYREMSDRFMDRSKELFVQAVETRGHKGHVKRCCRLAAALASMLDCSPQVQADLYEAAQYHDIGFVAFNKLEGSEAIKEHTQVGANLLRHHPELSHVAELVGSHHERFDGSGQPDQKAGDDLPLEGWILALVEDVVEHWENSLDTYEMKVREFFYGPAKHHHPDVVDALCGLVDSEQLQELLN